MKKFLLSMAVMLGALTASAATTINGSEFTANGNDATATKDGFTVTIAKGEATTKPALRADGSVRVYAKSTITISGGDMTSVVFNLAGDAKFRHTSVTANVGTIAAQAAGDTEVSWTGDANSVTFTVGEKAIYGTDGEDKAGQLRFSSITITGEGGGTVTPDPTPDPNPAGNLEVTFMDGTLGSFTVENKIESTWNGWYAKASGPACAIANSYVSGVNLAAESWLVSPEVALGSAATLSFDHAFGFYFPTEQGEFCVVRIQANGGEWEDLTVTNYPAKKEGKNWTDFVTNNIDLAAYNGKTVKVAFCYKNDGNQSVAWELQNFALKSTATGISDITLDENAPVEYFNLQGVRIAQPEAGQIVIRRQGNKVSKVLVK